MTNEALLLVWDLDEKPPLEHGDVALWRGFSRTKTEVSISQLVENNAGELRSQYLNLIYELGKAEINGKRVVDHLAIRSDFSFWWTTLLVEKCNYSKSPQIDNIIKLMAFSNWIDQKKYSKISLVTSNRELANAMRLLASNMGILFECEQVAEVKTTTTLLRRLYEKLPLVVQAFAWLVRYLISRWSLKGVGIESWRNSEATTSMVSYLFNLDPKAVEEGSHKSRYWAELPEMLEQEKIQSNWLHLYIKDDVLPTAKVAGEMIDRFNQSHAGNQHHATLDSFLSFRLLSSVIVDWCKTARLNHALKDGLAKKCCHLWPLLRRDFQASLMGVAAMNNLLYLSLFEKAMCMLPLQKQGLYLQENQGWEFGFVYAWRSSGQSSKLIGVPHSSIRYWDLRYFFDPRHYTEKGEYKCPLPDFVGVNGDASKKMYLEGGYPEGQLVEVEALRYLNLSCVANNRDNSKDSQKIGKTLLVLGEYLEENTARQMDLLQNASKLLKEKIQYVVKAHPACPVLEADYPKLDFVITNEPIHILIEHCLLVYTSNVTSAAVDAYCAGKPVITVLDTVKLNLSPLKGCDGVTFVNSPEELAEMLIGIGEMKNIEGQGKGFFYLDSDLPKWRALLVESHKAEQQMSLEGVK